jgi:hypothetical protein
MNMNNSASEAHDDEIDLYDLFRRIGKTLSNWFNAIGRGILTCFFFTIRNILPLAFSLLLGIGLSYLMKWSSKPFYTSEITLRSNAVPNAEMIAILNKLNLLLEEKNIQGLASSLSLSFEDAIKVKDIEAFWVIDKNRDQIPDYVDTKNKHNVYDTLDLRMQDRLTVKAKVFNPEILPVIREGLLSYVGKDPELKLKNEFRLDKADELLARLNYDIKQLDSLQKVKYFEETRNRQPEKGAQMIFLQEQKTQLVYEDIYKLFARKQEIDQEKVLYPEILTVVNDFYQPAKRYNGGLYYGIILIPVTFGFTLFFLIFYRNRKKLREIYQKY